MTHQRAHDGVGDTHRHPAADEREHAPAVGPLESDHPRPDDEGGRDRGVLLRQEAEGERGRAPDGRFPGERGVNGEHTEHGGHELGPAHEVGHGLYVHGVHREQQPRHERARRVQPAPG